MQNISMDEYTNYKMKGLHILLGLLRSSVGWMLCSLSLPVVGYLVGKKKGNTTLQ